MMCGYRRSLVQAMCAQAREFTFMRALALRWAQDPVALAVTHAPRLHGSSSYSFLRLVKLQLDAATSFLRMRRERQLTVRSTVRSETVRSETRRLPDLDVEKREPL